MNDTPDSGLACLVLMLRFQGIPADPEQLRHRFAGAEVGVTQFLRAAREHGLKAHERKVPAARLDRASLPALVAKPGGGWQILAKLVGDKVLLHDAAAGRPLMQDRAKFERGYVGTLVLMARRASLGDLARRFDVGWFLQAMHKYRRLLGEVLLASFFLQVFALVTPLFFQVVIDKVLVHRGVTTLDVLVVGLVAVSCFESLLTALRTHVFAHTTALLAQHRAVLGHQGHEGAADGRVGGDAVHGPAVVAPALGRGAHVPQIALGGRQAGRALVAQPGAGQAHCLRPNTHRAGPREGGGATAAPADGIPSERRAGELDPAVKRALVQVLGPGQVAQRERVAVGQVHALARMLLDQDAAGAGVAEVQHQVHRNRLVAPVGRHGVQELHARQGVGGLQQGKHDLVAGVVLAGPGQVLGPQRPAGAGGRQHLDQHLPQPVAHPGLGGEPGVGAGWGGEDELLLCLAVLGAGGDVGAAGRLGQQGGVEGDSQQVGAAGLHGGVGHDAGADPVGGALAVRLLPGAAAGQELEVGQGHPTACVHVKRLAPADGVGFVSRRHVAAQRLGHLPGFKIGGQFVQADLLASVRAGGAGQRLLPEGALLAGQRVDVQRRVPELDAAVGDQGDQRWHQTALGAGVTAGNGRCRCCRTARPAGSFRCTWPRHRSPGGTACRCGRWTAGSPCRRGAG